MKTLIIGTYLQIKNLLRVKKAVFFSFIFPAFIFILFSVVWGTGNAVYTKFLLTGIIALTVASDAIFSIGAVVAGYFINGEIKLFKVLPYNFNNHLLALVISRLFILIIAVALLIVIAIAFFNVSLTAIELRNIFLGVIIGTLIFSLIGLIVAGIAKEDSGNSGLTNLVFYALLFLSNCFYALTDANESLEKIAVINPFNPILEITRGNLNFTPIIIWAIILIIIQIIEYNNLKVRR
ncbi:MAG: ABC transporter permease [Tannerellaceae bacterium]|jgi:ABC-type multidrug transport system permease subunit|nr:ABC transporter permease [Tannerellaceae bacterium]